MLNKVELIGRLGADPEIKRMNNGNEVCNLRLATSEKWRDKNSGERKEKTEWHRITIWVEGLIKVAEQYLKKGDLVYIEGKIETRKWTDQSGAERYSTEVVVTGFKSTLLMLGGNGNGGGRSGGDDDDWGSGPRRSSSGGSRRSNQNTDMDDDIPF